MLTDNKQIHKRTTMRNQNRSAALGWPAIKLLGGLQLVCCRPTSYTFVFFIILQKENNMNPSELQKRGRINSLTTEKQTTKFSSANFQKMLSPSYIILRIQRPEGKINSVDVDEVANYEPPHQDLHCLQIQLFLSLVLKELRIIQR